jgi:prevent-host-death family protein
MTMDTSRTMGEATEIPAGECNAKCLKLMDEVRDQGKEIVITKRGKPVAKLVPVGKAKRPPLFGCMKGTIEYMGDVISPVDVEWEAMKE